MNEVIYMVAGVLVLIFIIVCAVAFKRTDSSESFDEMSGEEFEDFTADLLQQNGIEVVELTKASGDFGADIIIVYEGERTAVQCKRYSKPIGVKAVQEAVTAKSYYKCGKAAVFTNSTFTKQAQVLAAESGTILWDREDLLQFLNSAEKKNGCRAARGSLKFHRLLSGEMCEEPATLYINSTEYDIPPGETMIVSVETGEVKITFKLYGRKTSQKIILGEETRNFAVGDCKNRPFLSEIS